MIQRHKAITLTPFHPTNGGMNAYKNFPNGQRRILSNDNRFTPIVTKKDGTDWDPIYGVTIECTDAPNGTPGVFGETFNIDNIPTQIITNGVVPMPTDKYMAVPDADKTWKAGELLVLIPKSPTGWQIAPFNPVVSSNVPVTKYSNQQVGVLLETVVWKSTGGKVTPDKPTVDVLIGYSKIAKKTVNIQAVKAAPLATPKVATK